MYSLEEKAIHFLLKAFENKKRIKEDINLAFHSLCVGYMLKDARYNEELI